MTRERLAAVRSFVSRRSFCTAAALLMASAVASTAAAQQSQNVVTEETVETADGWSIPITYYQSTLGQDAPVVVLLPMEKGERLVWQSNGMAKMLQDKGFAVIAADLRKIGESQPPGDQPTGELKPLDYKAMVSVVPVGDLEAIKRFIFDEHQKQRLNMEMTGIVAPSEMAAVAMTWAEADWLKPPFNDAPTVAASTPRGQDVKAIVLLSPRDRVGGLSAAKAAATLQAFPMSFFVVWSNNTADKRDANKILDQVESAVGSDKRVFKNEYGVKLRGTELVGNPNLRLPPSEIPPEQLILGFFEKQLKDLNIDWRDRRSRLQR